MDATVLLTIIFFRKLLTPTFNYYSLFACMLQIWRSEDGAANAQCFSGTPIAVEFGRAKKLTNKKSHISVALVGWCGPGSNRRHKDFQSFALPTELPHQHLSCSIPISLSFIGILFFWNSCRRFEKLRPTELPHHITFSFKRGSKNRGFWLNSEKKVRIFHFLLFSFSSFQILKLSTSRIDSKT